MYMYPRYLFEIGLRSLKHNPFLNAARLDLQKGESNFRVLEGREGVVVTLGPDTSFFDRPNRSVCRWPGTITIPRQSPHPLPNRSRLMEEFHIFVRILCGGGDVQFNRVTAVSGQRKILLTAGEGNVVEKIDLTELAKEGAPPLMFLQPMYLCSSANVIIRTLPCGPSIMSWARAPFVYLATAPRDLSKPAILCVSGRTMLWCERLQPGESRDFALGNVIAATANLSSSLRPTGKRHPYDHGFCLSGRSHAGGNGKIFSSRCDLDKCSWRAQLRGFAMASKILLESIRTREGFVVCELTNHSDQPAYVFIQLNKSAFYGGSGLVGLVIKFVAAFFRWTHFSMGN